MTSSDAGYEIVVPEPVAKQLEALAHRLGEEAVIRLGPAWTYHLHVHPTQVFEAKNLLRSLAAHTIDNPFSPYVNVSADSELGVWAWYLAIEGKPRKVGSEGCP